MLFLYSSNVWVCWQSCGHFGPVVIDYKLVSAVQSWIVSRLAKHHIRTLGHQHLCSFWVPAQDRIKKWITSEHSDHLLFEKLSQQVAPQNEYCVQHSTHHIVNSINPLAHSIPRDKTSSCIKKIPVIFFVQVISDVKSKHKQTYSVKTLNYQTASSYSHKSSLQLLQISLTTKAGEHLSAGSYDRQMLKRNVSKKTLKKGKKKVGKFSFVHFDWKLVSDHCRTNTFVSLKTDRKTLFCFFVNVKWIQSGSSKKKAFRVHNIWIEWQKPAMTLKVEHWILFN